METRTWRVQALNRHRGYLSIAGVFSSAVEAAEWADANRPIADWRRIEILSRQRYSSLGDTDYMTKLEKENKHLQDIVDQFDVTADGVPITPETELWQAHPLRGWSLSNMPHPWPVGPGIRRRRDPDLPVYSTKEAAREAVLEPLGD
jgi:hypothetical protein